MLRDGLSLGRKAAWLLAGVFAAVLALETFFRLAGFVLQAARRPSGGSAEVTVLCAGDSFVFGTGGTPFPRQMEGLLAEGPGSRRFRVLNMGTPGQNSALLAQVLEAHLRAWRPEVLIVLVGQNNYWNVNRLRATQRPVPWRLTLRGLLSHSRVYKFLRVFFIGVRDTGFHYPDTPTAEVRTEDGRARAEGADDLLQAHSFESRGEPAKALELYRGYMGRNPRDAAGYAGAARVLFSQGKPKEAEAVLERGAGAERSPELEKVYHELGWLRRRAGDEAGAAKAWRDGLSRFPKSLLLSESLAGRASGGGGEVDEEELVSRSFRRDIRSISSLGRKYGAAVIFSSYPEMAHPEVAETAAAEGDRFVDFRPLFKERFKTRGEHVAEDDWHCNTAGYRLMAETLAVETRRALEGRQR